jgi:hypothetical protein
MDIEQIRTRWQEMAIIDLPVAMAECAAAVQKNSQSNIALLMLRGRHEKNEDDFQQGILSHDDRTKNHNQILLAFFRLIQDLKTEDLAPAQQDSLGPEVAIPELDLSLPSIDQPVLTYKKEAYLLLGELGKEQSAIFQEVVDSFIPAGKWFERIGEKIGQSSSEEDFRDGTFINDIMILMGKAAEVFEKLNQQIIPIIQRLKRCWQWQFTILENMANIGEKPSDVTEHQELLPLAEVVAGYVDELRPFRAQIDPLRSIESMIVLFSIHPGCYQHAQRTMQLVKQLAETIDEIFQEHRKHTLALELIFPDYSA